MGDVSKTANDQDPAIASVNNLHVSKPAENIAIPRTPNGSQEVLQKIHTPSYDDAKPVIKIVSEGKLTGAAKHESNTQNEKSDKTTTEETAEKPKMKEATESTVSVDTLSEKETKEPTRPEENIEVSKTPKDTPPSNLDKKPRIGSAASALNPNERIARNQSDIFSLKEHTTIASSIFSVNGSPSRKVYRNRELSPSNVFPFGQNFSEPQSEDPIASPRDRLRQGKDNYNDIKRPSSSIRNPLTGTGLSSNDEYKFKGSKRKDGNPLLGLGYTPEVTPSTHRIPPGGYSHKLW